jgi:molecular chaperone GrpE
MDHDQTQETVSTEQESVQPDYQALYQRALADQENARKRATQEREQQAKFAHMSAALDILPIVDNFSRALDHAPADQKDTSWITGVLYIQKQLTDVLETWGVVKMQLKPGDMFNPELHEALSAEAATDQPEDSILRVQTDGYLMHGRVLRSAQVIVASASSN